MNQNYRKIKIAYIGAGSAAWALTIVRDLIVSKTLSNTELVFVDIDPEKLEDTTRLAKRYNQITKGNLDIKATSKMEVAIQDADFVINSVLAGAGHVLQEKIRNISEANGYYRGIESREFNMVSDYSTLYSAYDQYHYIIDLVQKMRDIAPDAWLVNVSNPMLEVHTIILRENKIKAISYCDGTLHSRMVAEFFGVDPKKTQIQLAGVNHNIWLARFSQDGQDLTFKISEWVKEKSQEYWKNDPFYNTFDKRIYYHDISKHQQFSKAAIDMYKYYGLYPVGDTVRSGSWKYHYDLETKKKWYGPYGGFDSEIGWSRYLEHIKNNNELMKNLSTENDERILETIPPKMGEDPVIPFIEAILFDKKVRSHFDIRNEYAGEKIIPMLPSDVAVEVPALIDKNGIHPEQVQLNDRVIKECLIPRVVNMEMALEAYNQGSYDVLLEAIYRDVRTRSNHQAEQVLNSVLSIPENKGGKNHYR